MFNGSIEVTVCERDANGNPTGRVHNVIKAGQEVDGQYGCEQIVKAAQKGVKDRKARSRIRTKIGASTMVG